MARVSDKDYPVLTPEPLGVAILELNPKAVDKALKSGCPDRLHMGKREYMQGVQYNSGYRDIRFCGISMSPLAFAITAINHALYSRSGNRLYMSSEVLDAGKKILSLLIQNKDVGVDAISFKVFDKQLPTEYSSENDTIKVQNYRNYLASQELQDTLKQLGSTIGTSTFLETLFTEKSLALENQSVADSYAYQDNAQTRLAFFFHHAAPKNNQIASFSIGWTSCIHPELKQHIKDQLRIRAFEDSKPLSVHAKNFSDLPVYIGQYYTLLSHATTTDGTVWNFALVEDQPGVVKGMPFKAAVDASLTADEQIVGWQEHALNLRNITQTALQKNTPAALVLNKYLAAAMLNKSASFLAQALQLRVNDVERTLTGEVKSISEMLDQRHYDAAHWKYAKALGVIKEKNVLKLEEYKNRKQDLSAIFQVDGVPLEIKIEKPKFEQKPKFVEPKREVKAAQETWFDALKNLNTALKNLNENLSEHTMEAFLAANNSPVKKAFDLFKQQSAAAKDHLGNNTIANDQIIEVYEEIQQLMYLANVAAKGNGKDSLRNALLPQKVEKSVAKNDNKPQKKGGLLGLGKNTWFGRL